MNNCYLEKWDALYEAIRARGGNADELFAALKEYYGVFEDGVPVWIARLYDHSVGGFYYSNSARDNETVEFEGKHYPLLPDVESTIQAVGLIESSGILVPEKEFPPEMIEKIKNFVISLEDPDNGFFYHPQWPKEMANDKTRQARRGRDAMWAESLARRFGFSFPYPTAYERLATKTEDATVEIPEYMKSEGALIDYLRSFDWDTNAYYAGNMIAAQANFIKHAGLGDAAIEYMNSIQNKDTGLWGTLGGYMAVNAYLKITAFYNSVNRPIPNSTAAAPAILDVATTDEGYGTVCWQYNVWMSLTNIERNLTVHGGEKGCEAADEIRSLVLKNAAPAVRATARKVLNFKKPDGSFSYHHLYSSYTSQCMPVAIKNTEEGDVNATIICTGGTVENVFGSMGLSDHRIPLYSENAKEIFFANLKLD